MDEKKLDSAQALEDEGLAGVSGGACVLSADGAQALEVAGIRENVDGEGLDKLIAEDPFDRMCPGCHLPKRVCMCSRRPW